MSDPGGAAPRPAPDHDASDRRANVAGAVLVAVAVLIGVILLVKGFDDDGGFVTATKSDSASNQADNQGGDVPTTETTLTTVAVDPATVKVFSANASGTKSGARQVADALEAKGFVGVQVGNAPSAVASAVYYTPGADAQAALVASTLGLDASTVQPMPSPPPVADLKGATVLVVIGTDGKLANPGATTTTTAAADTTSSAP